MLESQRIPVAKDGRDEFSLLAVRDRQTTKERTVRLVISDFERKWQRKHVFCAEVLPAEAPVDTSKLLLLYT